ncbi:hypothetical protein Z517_09365 [Fonsecaea pedrosoi CBS 271.37]|uniref:Uncharacterized protein n=1 Tax=Fonsecaea pedrosoi CBS 271.37 TaxID=1442368 RepID=A0A0D2DGW4_9EURO|nr:uncharacterized protein Z517_09365 [Fonsecaea pedrosoi CBS 271.37]KIW76921.1 hypothetical protein Z517_09365 [Fonsecaea pedrosoi CBS 271.37]
MPLTIPPPMPPPSMPTEVRGMGDLEDHKRRILFSQLSGYIVRIAEKQKEVTAQVKELDEDREILFCIHDLERKLYQAQIYHEFETQRLEQGGQVHVGYVPAGLGRPVTIQELELIVKELDLVLQWQAARWLHDQSTLAYNRQSRRLCWQLRSISQGRIHQKGMNDEQRQQAEAGRQRQLDALLDEEEQNFRTRGHQQRPYQIPVLAIPPPASHRQY